MSGKFTCGFVLCAALAGCVRDDEPCPPAAEKEMFEVRVTDLASGGDITDSGAVEDVLLVVFDANGDYITRIEVAAGDIGREVELPPELLSRPPGERLQISAWGNLQENMVFDENIGAEYGSGSQFLGLMVNDAYADNWFSPGDVFFGLSTVTLGQERVHTVTLTQKTARMVVSVRGLPESEAEEYYFSMCEQNDGFTFEGTPLRTNEWCKIRESGVFNAAGEFTTDEPYYVIPSTDPSDVSACNAGVCLYRIGGGSAARAGVCTRALTSADAGYVTEEGDLNVTGKARVDVDGNHLALSPGLTTNVLMTLTPTGDIKIEVEMTDWDEIYNWSNW